MGFIRDFAFVCSTCSLNDAYLSIVIVVLFFFLFNFIFCIQGIICLVSCSSCGMFFSATQIIWLWESYKSIEHLYNNLVYFQFVIVPLFMWSLKGNVFRDSPWKRLVFVSVTLPFSKVNSSPNLSVNKLVSVIIMVCVTHRSGVVQGTPTYHGWKQMKSHL